MKILVTGGAGFIGSHLVDALLNRGHEVHIVDDLSTGKIENLNPNAKFWEMDLSLPGFVEVLEREKFEVIFHLAAQLDVRKSVADPVFDAQVNVIGSLRLLEGAMGAGLKKFIFSSSGGTVYGEQEYFPADENHVIRPISPYGVAKATVEMYLHYYQTIHGLPYVSLRYANVYGPRQNPHGEAGVVAIFANKILDGQQPVINGDGKQTRDYVFVGDVVKANLAALDFEGSGAFNVGTGVETDVVALYDAINAFFGNPFVRKHGPAKAGEQLRSVLAWKGLHNATGWKPEVSFADGLRETMLWFQNRHR